jgi:hypothetical protein
MPRVDVGRACSSGDQSSDTMQSDSKFVFKFSTSGRIGQNLFFKAERGGGAPKTTRESDAAQTPVFDYWSGARHANNMTPRGRRLGPEACVIIQALNPQSVDPLPIAELLIGRSVECEKAELRTEAEIIQVKERGGGDKITPPPRKTKKNCVQGPKKKTRKPRGRLGPLLLCGQRGTKPAHKG